MPEKPLTDAEIIAGSIYDLSKSVRLLGMGNIDRGKKEKSGILAWLVEGAAKVARNEGNC